MVATTVAPPPSNRATTDAAMEPFDAPVTTATSSAWTPGAGFSAPEAIRAYSDAWPSRPSVSARPRHQSAWVATTWPAPSKRSDSRVPVGVDIAFVGQPQGDEVLAGTGPAVVEQHRLAGVEDRGHQTGPVGAQFGGDQFDQFGVGHCRRRR